MIITRIVRDAADMKDLLETSSDANWKLRQIETGKIYGAVVVDVIPCPYTYEETDEKDESEETIEDKAEAYDILMGVES